jgi:hypothetical protein
MKKLSDFEQTAEHKIKAEAVVEAFKEELSALVAKYNGFPGILESEVSFVSAGISKALYAESIK